ncbi:MAG: RedB protein [Patescibacteria group bacterium]
MAGALWIVAIGAGFGFTWRYASTPGTGTHAPATWPPATRLVRASDRYTLVMFVHPHCPCSRASLTELGKLTTRLRGRLATEIVFVRDSDEEKDLVERSLRDRATGLPDTRIVDEDGDEAQRFGAKTSGAVVLYDNTGNLAYAGGITAERSHEGDSLGQERIVSLVTTGKADRSDGPVFGCELDEKKETR